MEHHLGMVYIHGKPRKCLQQHLPQIPVDLLRGLGILLVRSPGIHLKGKVLPGVHLVQIRRRLLFQLLKAKILHLHQGADRGNPEHPL